MSRDYKELRKRVEQAREGLYHGGPKLFEAVGPEVMEAAYRLRNEGLTWSETGRRVGVSSTTLHRWRARKSSATKIQKAKSLIVVETVETEQAETKGELSLVSPAGFRLEGLVEEQALRLLWALR